MKVKVECLSECEFQKFKEGSFHCGYYNMDLIYSIQDMGDDLRIVRCEACQNEDIIGKNTTQEKAK